MNAENSRKYLDPRVLAELQGLELRARMIVEGYVSGLHRSPFQGFSIEFAEHREYVPGDDLRYVDWKVFGKTDKIYLKQYEEETNLICYLLLDVSESMQYRSAAAALSKLEYAQCLAAALGYLVLHQQDSVGLATFDREIRSFVRPSGNPAQLRQIVSALDQPPGRERSALGAVLHAAAERFRKRGVVVLLSDLFEDPQSILAGLKHLRHRRHEVVVLQILDPAEVDFPFDRPVRFQGLEALGDLAVDPVALRKAYRAEVTAFQHEIQRGCRARRIDYAALRTDELLDSALSSYLSSRMAHVR